MNASIDEEHSGVLARWWRLRRERRTVVCLDAHLDLQTIGEPRITALQSCGAPSEIAALAKRHPLLPDIGTSYGLENHLYAAGRLEIIRRLVWVVPPHIPSGFNRSAFEQLSQLDGVTPEDLASFHRRADGVVEGTLLGLEIAICTLERLEAAHPQADALIDIDIDFFIRLPGDIPWISPRQVCDRLRHVVPRPAAMTLSRSVASGFTPLRYRFLADHLAALWEGDEPTAQHYDRLFALDAAARSGAAHAARDCRAEVERLPSSAAAWHLLSLTSPAEATRAADRAAAISAAYRADSLRAVSGVRNRRLPADPARLEALRAWVNRHEPDADRRRLVTAELGMLFARHGDLAGVANCHRHVAEAAGGFPELDLELGRLLAATEEPRMAVPLLEAALADDKTRTAAACMLGVVALTLGNPREARQWLERATVAASAWAWPHGLLALAAEMTGDTAAAARSRKRVEQISSLAAELTARLGQVSAAGAGRMGNRGM